MVLMLTALLPPLLLVVGASAGCTDITARDALMIVDTQNSFIESFPLPGQPPQYPIPPEWESGGSIKPGALAVTNSSQVVSGINAWITHFSSSGGKIFASLDWHPTNHCSFCRNGTHTSNPGGFHPAGAVCPALPQPGFNDTGRCKDSVAQADYRRGSLVQWPDHCVYGTFGSRFSPFLKIPASTTVVKKGWDLSQDTYSAFGGTESKQRYPFDTRDTMADLATRPGLGELLEDAKVERLWVMGLATDFCVGGTTLDALGANPDTGRTAPAGLQTVVLVEGCARPVAVGSGRAMVEKIGAAGGVVVSEPEPVAAIQQACSRGTSGVEV